MGLTVVADEIDQCSWRAGVAAASLDDFKHRAIAVRPSIHCPAEKIASGVGDQPGKWTISVGEVEADERGGVLAQPPVILNAVPLEFAPPASR